MDRYLTDHILFSSPLAEGIAPLGLSPSWIVLVSAVLFVVYLTFRPKRRDPLANQPFRTSLVQQRSLERDMQNVVVELSEMTRQMSAQLETRSLKLEQLMADADAKMAELDQKREAFAQDLANIAAQANSLRAGTFAAESGGESALTAIASDVISPTSASSRPAMRLVTEDTEDRWAEVYRLGDEGLTLTEIARRLARPNGEVELILALRPKPAEADDAAKRSESALAQ